MEELCAFIQPSFHWHAVSLPIVGVLLPSHHQGMSGGSLKPRSLGEIKLIDSLCIITNDALFLNVHSF